MKRYARLRLRDGAHWPTGEAGRKLCRRLNRVGKAIGMTVTITSGQRTWREQHAAYMDFLRGGTLAAPCCSKRYLHTAAECRRDCQSRHCSGEAADCVLETSEGRWVNIGELQVARRAMARYGCCLPVGFGETWHVELGDTWRS